MILYYLDIWNASLVYKADCPWRFLLGFLFCQLSLLPFLALMFMLWFYLLLLYYRSFSNTAVTAWWSAKRSLVVVHILVMFSENTLWLYRHYFWRWTARLFCGEIFTMHVDVFADVVNVCYTVLPHSIFYYDWFGALHLV